MTWSHSPRRWFLTLAALALATGATRAQAPKADKYPFTAPPLEIYERLGKLGIGPVEPIPAGDAKLISDSLDTWMRYWDANVRNSRRGK